MNDANDQSDILRSVLIDEAEARAGGHPGLEELTRYHDGTLEAGARERVRDHLAICRQCADELLDLEPLMRPEEAPAAGVSDLEIEAAWRRFQVLAGAAGPARVAPRPRWAMALAAALLILAVGLSVTAVRLWQERSELRLEVAELTQPEVNTPVFYLHGVTRGRDDENTIDVPPLARRFLLILTSADLGAAEEYGVEFLDEAGGKVWSRQGLKTTADGGLRLSLPRGYLPAGVYDIRLLALEGETWTLVQEYRRAVRYSPGPADGAGGEPEPGAR